MLWIWESIVSADEGGEVYHGKEGAMLEDLCNGAQVSL